MTKAKFPIIQIHRLLNAIPNQNAPITKLVHTYDILENINNINEMEVVVKGRKLDGYERNLARLAPCRRIHVGGK